MKKILIKQYFTSVKFAVLLMFFLVFAMTFGIAKNSANLNYPTFQKGMCYVTWNPNAYLGPKSDESLRAMADSGVNCVQIVVTWYQEKADSFIIKRVEERTPTDESLIHAIKTAHKNGMLVMVKPHIDLIKDEGTCRSDIGFSADADWEKWFSNYKKLVKYYAQLSEENNVEFFCVGTELSYAASKDDVWRNSIIPAVRKVFSGKITYAANWDDYKKVKFWDLVDYAGIDAYFPLTTSSNPTLGELKEGWKKWLREIEEWQKTINKPVVFTECGYCSADNTAKRPWEEIFSSTPNLRIQTDCYRALFETFCGKPWFYGLYWWAWNTYPGSGGKNHSRFTPQNKPALEQVRLWYSQILAEKIAQ